MYTDTSMCIYIYTHTRRFWSWLASENRKIDIIYWSALNLTENINSKNNMRCRSLIYNNYMIIKGEVNWLMNKIIEYSPTMSV